MAYKGLIVVNPFDNSANNQYKVERMTTELKKLNIDTTVVKNDNFMCYIKDGKTANTVSQYDFALYLDKDKYTARMLESCGVRVFNSSQAIQICDDKMLTHIELARHNIAMPTTLAGALCYRQDSKLPDNYLDTVERTLGYPLVMKQCYGSYGQQVYLINNRQQLEEMTNQLKCKAYLFQQYIGAHKGQDIRAIVVGGKLLCAMKRVSNGDFRSNLELGGTGYNIQLDNQFTAIAERCAQALQLDYCGVDILIDKDGSPLVCEVNSNAMFGGMEKVSGQNVALAFAQHILDSLSRGR